MCLINILDEDDFIVYTKYDTLKLNQAIRRPFPIAVVFWLAAL